MDEYIDDFEELCREVSQMEVRLEKLEKEKLVAREKVEDYLQYKERVYTTVDGMRMYELVDGKLEVTSTEFYK